MRPAPRDQPRRELSIPNCKLADDKHGIPCPRCQDMYGWVYTNKYIVYTAYLSICTYIWKEVLLHTLQVECHINYMDNLESMFGMQNTDLISKTIKDLRFRETPAMIPRLVRPFCLQYSDSAIKVAAVSTDNSSIQMIFRNEPVKLSWE
jgi:hypothetical protein